MHLSDWFPVVFGQWQTWLSGGGIGGVAVIVVGILDRWGKWPMSKKWYAAIFLGAFFLGANYVAWLQAFTSMKGREKDLHETEIKLQLSQNRVKGLEGIQAEEATNSLRHRTLALAGELYSFVNERKSNHPPYAYPPQSNQPPPDAEQQKAIDRCRAYEEETMSKYVTKKWD